MTFLDLLQQSKMSQRNHRYEVPYSYTVNNEGKNQFPEHNLCV